MKSFNYYLEAIDDMQACFQTQGNVPVRFTNYLKREGYNRLDLLQACDAFFDKHTNVQHLRDIIYKVIKRRFE